MKATAIDQFLGAGTSAIPPGTFFMQLVSAALLGGLLGVIYTRFGASLSNRRQLAGSFSLLAVTTMLIISVVKSSLALSLGLVGALSIVRFRTPVKEPEELIFILIAIAVGLGIGANQVAATFGAFFALSVIAIARSYTQGKRDAAGICVCIVADKLGDLTLPKIIEVFAENCDRVDLKRVDETSAKIEVVLVVSASNYLQIELAKNSLYRLLPEESPIQISTIDTSMAA